MPLKNSSSKIGLFTRRVQKPVPCKNLIIQSVLLQKPENPILSIGRIGPPSLRAHSQMAWSILNHIFSTILSIINITRLSNQEKDLEILILRQQLSILLRKHNSPIKPKRVEKITSSFVERWVRSVCEECLDHILIVNHNHLHRVLIEYVNYYNHIIVITRVSIDDSPLQDLDTIEMDLSEDTTSWDASSTIIIGNYFLSFEASDIVFVPYRLIHATSGASFFHPSAFTPLIKSQSGKAISATAIGRARKSRFCYRYWSYRSQEFYLSSSQV